MNHTGVDILYAIAIILVVEGLLYAIFPDRMKRILSLALSMDRDKLARTGLGMALAGIAILWLSKQLD